jgi:hypothetical protein
MLSSNRSGLRFTADQGESTVQSTQPRDVAALALVVGMFLILFVITVLFGAPAR